MSKSKPFAVSCHCNKFHNYAKNWFPFVLSMWSNNCKSFQYHQLNTLMSIAVHRVKEEPYSAHKFQLTVKSPHFGPCWFIGIVSLVRCRIANKTFAGNVITILVLLRFAKDRSEECISLRIWSAIAELHFFHLFLDATICSSFMSALLPISA